MIIAIGSDHRGFKLKEYIKSSLSNKTDLFFKDIGTNSLESCDYPDIANIVCKKLQQKAADFGILICYSGIGMSIAANRNYNIRAALCSKPEDSLLARQHNDANIIVLGTKNQSQEEACKMVIDFLNTKFAGGHHSTRVQKLNKRKKNSNDNILKRKR